MWTAVLWEPCLRFAHRLADLPPEEFEGPDVQESTRHLQLLVDEMQPIQLAAAASKPQLPNHSVGAVNNHDVEMCERAQQPVRACPRAPPSASLLLACFFGVPVCNFDLYLPVCRVALLLHPKPQMPDRPLNRRFFPNPG